MKVCDLAEKLKLTVFCGEDRLQTEVTGGYAGDLLSDVMGHLEEGRVWITLQTHPNVAAVAALKDAAAVLLINGATPDEETLRKGREEGLVLLGTELPAFEACGKIYRLLENS